MCHQKRYLLEFVDALTFVYANSSMSGGAASCMEGTGDVNYDYSLLKNYARLASRLRHTSLIQLMLLNLKQLVMVLV